MDKKIDLDEIIRKMYEKFPGDILSEVEKARYLYIELGKLLKYDIDYYTDYDVKMLDVYYKSVDFDNITENEYVCTQISSIYAEALRRVRYRC
ncbi:MAG: hypothetical protein HFJ46_01745 [Clostridia bacterium]|jgi:hypothetical protein|nr:hypothetical protein [Clostridia bacterium]